MTDAPYEIDADKIQRYCEHSIKDNGDLSTISFGGDMAISDSSREGEGTEGGVCVRPEADAVLPSVPIPAKNG